MARRDLIERVRAEQKALASAGSGGPPKDAVATILTGLHPRERQLVEDQSRFITAVCGRRAGKTEAVCAALIISVLLKPGACALYITKTRRNSKKILWGRIKRAVARLNIGAVPNETEMMITFPSGSQIYLEGANDRDKVEDFRGVALVCVVLDEAQNFPAYIKELIDQSLAPALMDHNGRLLVVGTPGPVPVGYFHAAAHSPGWSHHAWTAWDNPSIEESSGQTIDELLDAECERRGVKRDDPVVLREWFGKWITDLNSLAFKYDPQRNIYKELPTLRTSWDYVMGIDIGFKDADAISVLAFNRESPVCYCVEEVLVPNQTITPLIATLEEVRERLLKKGNVVAMVMDEGGLGKKIGEEIRQRTSIPVKPAEKSQKAGYIELVNDALRTGKLLFLPNSKFGEDALKVEWDRDRSTPDRRVLDDDKFHSDICDSLLYAYRESLHWTHTPETPPPLHGTPEWFAQQVAEMEAAALERSRQATEDHLRARDEEWREVLEDY